MAPMNPLVMWSISNVLVFARAFGVTLHIQYLIHHNHLLVLIGDSNRIRFLYDRKKMVVIWRYDNLPKSIAD